MKIKHMLLAAVLAGFGLAGAAAQPALATTSQAGPFGVGNLLNYANADLESGLGNWYADSNVSSLTQNSTAFLHAHSMLAIAASSGSVVVTLGQPGASSAVLISLPKAGAKYRVGAYLKVPATTRQDAEFDLQCYTSSGTLIRWVDGSPVSLNSSGGWQYAQDNITVPSTCAELQASPRMTVTGLSATAHVRWDEISLAPYRAALVIGAHADTPSDWETYTSPSQIGPLQSDKVFFTPTQPLPAHWSDAWNNDGGGSCYAIEQALPANQWPVCVLAYKAAETESQLASFLSGVPPAQEVVMVWYQEPEHNTFNSEPGCGTDTGATAFKCEFDLQSSYIRQAAGGAPNIFVAMDASTYQYDNSGDGDGDEAGAGCVFIPSATNVDFYFADHYAGSAGAAQVDGTSLPTDGGSGADQAGGKWSYWLSCVQGKNKPIGVAEYGLDCGYNPDVTAVTQSMAADSSYLAAIPNATEPTFLWEYWYQGGCLFDNTAGGITQWQSNEDQNGGAVNRN